MKIAILTPTLWYYSGIDRVVEEQVKNLVKRGDRVTIFVLDAQIKISSVEIIVLGMPKSLFWQRIYRLFFFLDLPKILFCLNKLKNFNCVFAHQYPMTVIVNLSKIFNKTRYIYYNYGIAPPGVFTSIFEKLYIILFTRFCKISIMNADEVISISEFLAEDFEKETAKRSLVEYPKIDKKRFSPLISGARIRKRLKLKNSPVILYVGRISPHKGVHLLIESFQVIKKDMPDVKLLIVGKHTFGEYSRLLKERAQEIGSVIFCGEVLDKELPEYYAASDLYTTCSLWEGFDLPLAEAQAMGKPGVAFDIGPHKEIATKNTFLTPPEDKQKFADACLKLLKKNENKNNK